MLSKLVTNLVALLCINGLFYKKCFPQTETSGAQAGELRMLINSSDILGIDNLKDNAACVLQEDARESASMNWRRLLGSCAFSSNIAGLGWGERSIGVD